MCGGYIVHVVCGILVVCGVFVVHILCAVYLEKTLCVHRVRVLCVYVFVCVCVCAREVVRQRLV
jgi:hypothetical protein